MDPANVGSGSPRGYTIDDLRAAMRHHPWIWGDPAASARHARIGPEPDGTPWNVTDDRVVLGGEAEPRVMRVILPDGRTAYMEAPPQTGSEELVSRDAVVMDRGREVPASQRFAAMDPEQVEAARALLRDYPDTVPYNEVGRRGLTLDDVSLVYSADSGNLPAATTTDPWRPPAAAPWQPTTAAPDTEHDAQHDAQPAARVADIGPERSGETTRERLGPATDVSGEDPEITAVRTALDRLVDGEITDDDLDRIGITPDQYAQLFSADVNADIDRPANQHRAEPAADAETATAHLPPARDPLYANLTQEDHQANRRAAYDAWTSTVRREWAERDRAASDTGPSPSAPDSAAPQRWFDTGWAPAVADEPGLEHTAASDDASALDNDGDEPYVDFGRDVIDDDIVVSGIADSTDLATPDGDSGLPRLTATERDPRLSQVSSDDPAADPHARFQHRLDRLQDRLNDIQQALHNDLDQALHNTIHGIHRSFARERAPTGDAVPDASTHRGRRVNPDISDGLDPPYGYPADPASTDLADPRYQQSEIDPGPNIEI